MHNSTDTLVEFTRVGAQTDKACSVSGTYWNDCEENLEIGIAYRKPPAEIYED